MLKRRITVLGATGSIGASTAAVVEELLASGAAEIEVEALTGGRNVRALASITRRLRPKFVAVSEESLAGELRTLLEGVSVEIGAGPAALVEAASRPADWVMSAITGAAALEPTRAAIDRGASVALANKECLVCAGALLLEAARASGAKLLPVDSEHNAIFQVLGHPDRVEKMTLTASGGPFRKWSRERMASATPDEACLHPNWSMGRKISVDSATLMNKGLELIEASLLFSISEERVDVVIHPQSIIHSMVSYCDGSVLAQLGAPDMRVPISYALAWPDRAPVSAQRLDLAALGELTFESPDLDRFPALRLAREALRAGGAAPAILNAANETAVESFLAGRIGFLGIAGVVDEVLQSWEGSGLGAIAKSPSSFDEVRSIDAAARIAAREAVGRSR
ncbi:MAG: 1-deoxy-D-xylulose-5-phosphate reductoisomerase [Hyphomonadaceae bacterium]|nr:MAG: 1-deoxy-D-xylulose-5-phosphate reductoisomerase [Caulobacteraceae bacterium]MBT9445065.1 1-deoxy-D-xylulose-5-phosphate reductoisomerase [Hyphomonadaceae bacterium]TPW08928.1 MAG: 1-deoxy-D-xylulose-5-phosphate reductoisomerase [Alphaproteobacteria bacterium]